MMGRARNRPVRPVAVAAAVGRRNGLRRRADCLDQDFLRARFGSTQRLPRGPFLQRLRK